MTLDDMKSKVLELNRKEQLEFSVFLSQLLHPTTKEFDQHWLEVVNTRIENVKNGTGSTVPLQDVLENLEKWAG